MLCQVFMYIIAFNSHNQRMPGVNLILLKGKDLEVKQFTHVSEVWSNMFSNVYEGPKPCSQSVESNLLLLLLFFYKMCNFVSSLQGNWRRGAIVAYN